MGNYGKELKEDAMKEMVKLVREADGTGVSRQTLADAVGVSPSCVSNWMSEAMHRHPEIEKPHGSKVGYRWVEGNAGKPESPEQKELKEQIIDFLKKHSPEGTTSSDIAKAVGVSRCTVLRRLHEIAEDHIELNLAQRGSTRGYIWTEVVEKTSDEIDPNDVEAIQAAFGQKTALIDPDTDTHSLASNDALEKEKERVNKLPEFSWKDEVKEQREEKATMDESVSPKNHEGYNDPTAATAIRSADKEKTPDTSMAGEVWAIDRTYGGEDYFAILTSSNSHVCGVILRYENDGHPMPDNAFVYKCGGADWVGNTQRVCTKPIKALKRKVDDLLYVRLASLRDAVRQALDLGDNHSVEDTREIARLNEQVAGLQTSERLLRKKAQEFQDKAADLENELRKQDELAAKLAEENTGLLAEIERLKSQLADTQSSDRIDEITLRSMRVEQAADKATIKAYEFALQCLGGKEAK